MPFQERTFESFPLFQGNSWAHSKLTFEEWQTTNILHTSSVTAQFGLAVPEGAVSDEHTIPLNMSTPKNSGVICETSWKLEDESDAFSFLHESAMDGHDVLEKPKRYILDLPSRLLTV
jgi:hypothetical protein